MTTDTFLKNFCHWVDAPNGIPKLRELVLLLGIQGKLVEPIDDEPMNFANSDGDIAEHCKQVGIRVQKRVIEVDEQDEPWKLPQQWSWQRLGNISIYNGRQNLSPEQLDGNMWSLELEDIEKSSSRLLAKKFVRERRPKSTRTTFVKGDVLYGKLRPYLDKVLIADDDGYATTEIAPIVVLDGLNPYYLRWVLKSRYFIQHVNSLTYGINLPRLNTTDARNVAIPVPPTAEQQIIVDMIDELMALCDELEQRQQKRASVRSKLNKASLHSLTTATDDDAFQTAWARIRHNFDTLYTTPESVQDLRQSILQLAVQGKLVPQDPSDSGISHIMERVKSKQEVLLKEKKIKRPKSTPRILKENIPYETPKDWKWIRIGDFCELINGDRSKNYPNKEEYVSNGVAWINTGHIDPDGTLSIERMNYISEEKYNSLNGGFIEHNDLVYCLRGATIGKTAFVTPFTKGAIASSLVIIRSYLPELIKYLYLYLISPIGKKQILKYDNGSAQPNLSANSVRLFLVPLPPIEEQRRIAEKVSHLMEMCNQLEAVVSKSQSQAEKLMAAIVHNLTNGSDSTPSESTKPSKSNPDQMTLGV